MDTTENETTVRERERLALQIDGIVARMSTATAAEISELAEQLTQAKQDADALTVETITTAIPTGETFGDLLERDPRLVVTRAIERVIVQPPVKAHTPGNIAERVQLVWAETAEAGEH
jgi:hypothetical protein